MDNVTLYTYKAKLIRILDADTMEVDIDLGFGVVLAKRKLRLDGLDSPEIKTPEGVIAKEATENWLKENTTIKKQLTISSTYVTFQSISDKPDKYGRILAKVIGKDGATLNEYLVETGMAKSYDGGKRN